MIYRAKKSYFKAIIEIANKDSKSLLQSLRDLGMPSKKIKTSSSALGLKIPVQKKINEFYTTVASKLVEKLQKSLNKFGKKFAEIFYRSKGVTDYSVVSESKVLKYRNVLSVNKATGLDSLPSRFVRISASVIVCPLSHIIN